MHRLYSLVLGMVMAVVMSVAASAYSVTVKVDSAANVSMNLTVGETTTAVTVVKGDNVINYSDYGTLAVKTADGIMMKVENVKDGYTAAELVTSYNMSLSPYSDGGVYSITTAKESDLRSASFVLCVDNPEAIAVTRGGTYTNVEGLVAGANTVRFAPDKENTIMLRAAVYGTPLYSVTLNGAEQTESYGSYNINVAQGDTVKVVSAFPEGPAALAISYVGEVQGCISKMAVNGEEVNVTDNFSGKLGDKVEVYFNEADYVISSLKFNDDDPYTSSWGYYSYSMVLKQAENTLVIEGSKNATFDVTLKLNDPSHVDVFRGSEWDYDLFEGLAAGDNSLSFTSDNTLMTVKGKNGAMLKSVTANGEAVTVSENKAAVTVSEGMVVEVVTGEAQRDNTMVVYVDDINGAQYGHSCTRSDRSTFELVSGYNTVKYDAADLPILFAFYMEGTAPAAYNNGQTFAPKYEGGSTYELTEAVNNGTVLKFYFNGTPADCNVSFTLGEGIEATVLSDLILPVAVDAAAPVKVLAGTRFDMTVAAQEGLEVKVNDAVLAPVDNVYTFTVTADTSVQASIANGVENVRVSNAADSAVYNLQGVRVGDSLDKLPAGIYITGGKKVTVK